MKRLLSALVLVGLFGLAAGSPARAQDKVRYYDRAKKMEVTVDRVTIQEETPSQIAFKVGARTEKVPSADVLEVTYKIPVTLSAEYRKPGNKEDKARQAAAEGKEDERKKLTEETVKEYEELLPKLNEVKSAQRNAQYKLVQFVAWAAEDDPTQVKPAITAGQKFLKDHTDGWQVVSVAKLVARLQASSGDLAEAQKTYAWLADQPVAPEIKQECDLLVVKALIDNNKHADAEAKLKELKKSLPPDDPQAQRVQVYLAGCEAARGNAQDAEKQLQDIIQKSSDADVKALAYNTLGDCLRKTNTPEALDNAMWNYLWVDVLYNQDKQEHAHALYYLSKLFDQVRKDPTRAEECRKRLVDDKQFAGLEYQRRAMKDEK